MEDSRLTAGRPDAEIVDWAEEIGADLIVMGSRGVGRVRRALFGSVGTLFTLLPRRHVLGRSPVWFLGSSQRHRAQEALKTVEWKGR